MTHDVGSTPRTPTGAPEAAKLPRTATPEGPRDHGTTDTPTTDSPTPDAGPPGAGATATARRPDETPAGKPRMAASATAALHGDRTPTEPTSAPGGSTPGATTRPLFPDGDHDRLSQRLQHAVSEFVESPRRAVEEAESTFDTVVDGLTDSLKEYRRALGTAGQDGEPGMRTEELRVALQHYRDLTERLLKV
ncbi:hypothetical protein ACIBKZ_01140 [Streptomyces sp. NPDC050421]|uniref:hypothetical protein n=1 Tax=Streptomyces sp. NPDC050421 TaxID=3365613 RepID=UPI00378E6202